MGRGRDAVIALSALGTSASLITTYIWLRQFRRRRIQSMLLRNEPTSRIDTLVPGSYVRLEGWVGASHPLLSPEKRVRCVIFRTVRLRVLDTKVTEDKTATEASLSGGEGFLTALATVARGGRGRAARAGLKSSRQSTRERWDVVEQEVSCNAEAAPIYLRDQHGQIRVDVEGAEFFELETVFEAFEQATGLVGGSSRQTLGFKTVEKVLAEGKRLIVLGEVGRSEVPLGLGLGPARGSGASGTHSPGEESAGSADSGGSGGSYEIVGEGAAKAGSGGGGGGASEGTAHPDSQLPVAEPLVQATAAQPEEQAATELVVHKPLPRHMFDLKTTAILKPFVVSTLPQNQLLAQIETSARSYLLSSLAALTAGIAAASVGARAWALRR